VGYHEIATTHGAFVGGNRSGKTHGGLADDLIQTLPLELLPPWLHGSSGGGTTCRSSAVSSARICPVAWPDDFAEAAEDDPAGRVVARDFDRAYDQRDHKLQFADGAMWDFLTHDMAVDAFASVDLMRVHFDEEPVGELGRQQYEESLWRIVDHDGEIRWTLTPLLGLDFVYDELNDNDRPRWDDECRVVIGDIDHNPHLSESGRKKA
jgi:hypothetical protein